MRVKKLFLIVTAMLFLLVLVSSVDTAEVRTITVSPFTTETLIFSGFAGDTFRGSLSISGGSGNDIDFWITGPRGNTVVNLGRVSGTATFAFTAKESGPYTFHFDNTFSWFSSKTVSLSFDKTQQSSIAIDPLIVASIGLFVIVAMVLVFLYRVRGSTLKRCPSCGAGSIFGIRTKNCAFCGKAVCNKCVPTWRGSLSIKTSPESASTSASYATVGFCSNGCFNQFWQKVLDYPMNYHIGPDVDNLHKNWVKVWNDSIVNVFTTSTPDIINKELVTKVRLTAQIHTERFVAFPWLDSSGKHTWMAQKSYSKACLALAQNLEMCGRPLDAAKVYERLRIYDKAKELREKEKYIMVKKTDISVNLNALLQQVKDGGIVVFYRCPHCGGTLKISKNTSAKSLKICHHCGSEIEAMDLADFLKTTLL